MESKSKPATRGSDGSLIDGATLRPCPFCSQEAQITTYPGMDDGPVYFVATCSNCLSEGPSGDTEIMACDAWNSPGNFQGGLNKVG